MLSLCWMSVNSWWNLSRVRPNAIRIPKTSCWIRNLAKTLVCKTRQTRYLKNTFKKDWESHCLIENTHYFCTRNNAEVHRNPGKPTRIEVENLFSKKVQKSLRDSKTDVTFAPRNWATFLEKMARKRRKQRKEIFEKKTSKKACRIKKELLLLHPLIERKAHE